MMREEGQTRVYFIGDAHLGANYIAEPRRHEALLTALIDHIAADARAVYLMGDILDFWFEYRTVVPRGYVRFFGALARLADSGVKLYWFRGNHDMWLSDYLSQEIGFDIIDNYAIHKIEGRTFFLAHGDGVGRQPRGYRMLRWMFRNSVCRRLCASIHPRWILPFAHGWSSHSRGEMAVAPPSKDDDVRICYDFACEYAAAHPGEVDYFVFGHCHAAVQKPVAGSDAEFVVVGDFFRLFTYGVFDGKKFVVEHFATEAPQFNMN